MLEFFRIHSNVLQQPAFDDPHFHGLNPYVLGFNIFRDLKRMCTHPTEEDRNWFASLVDRPWGEVLDFAMRYFSDSDFIAQYLSPQVMREMKLFTIRDDSAEPNLEITAIHNEAGYAHLRNTLARQFELAEIQPRIRIQQANMGGNHLLLLEYPQYLRRPLNANLMKILEQIHALWRGPVELMVTEDGACLQRYAFPMNLST